jgi:hypothetical protein
MSMSSSSSSTVETAVNYSPWASIVLAILAAIAILAVAILATLSYVDITKTKGVPSSYKNIAIANFVVAWIAFIIVAVAVIGGIAGTNRNKEMNKVQYGIGDSGRYANGVMWSYGIGLGVVLLLLLATTVMSFVLYFTVKAKYALIAGIISVVAFIIVIISALTAGAQKANEYYVRYTDYSKEKKLESGQQREPLPGM